MSRRGYKEPSIDLALGVAMAVLMGAKSHKRKSVTISEEEGVRISALKERAEWNENIEKKKAKKKDEKVKP